MPAASENVRLSEDQAIIYFGEMLVVSIFAIVLLVISSLEIGSAAAVSFRDQCTIGSATLP
jgi:hypothetical protein